MGSRVETAAKVEYPARLIADRYGARLDPPALVLLDPEIIHDDQRLAQVTRYYTSGSIHYTLTLCAARDVARVVAERWAALELLANPRRAMAAAAQPSALDRAYLAARLAFAGDRKALGRLSEALPLVRGGQVRDLGAGTFEVTSWGSTYTVDGQCSCPEFGLTAGAWCTHRLAVGLWIRTAQLENEEAESAATLPASSGDPSQEIDRGHYTTVPGEEQGDDDGPGYDSLPRCGDCGRVVLPGRPCCED